MFKRLVSLWLCILLCMTGLGMLCVYDTPINIIGRVAGETLYVNKTGSGGAFTFIQDAIDFATDGDTVFIYSGTYDESVRVDRRINLTGEGRDTTIIDGSGSGYVVFVDNINGVDITGLSITYGDTGIRFVQSSSNFIHNNNIFNNAQNGIFLDASSNNNTFSSNNISFNAETGIDIRSSTKNNIFGNDIISNVQKGISLDSAASDTIIQGNVISFNVEGIIITSSNNIITDNNISSNINVGLSLGVSSDNKVYHNNFINNALQAQDGTGNGNQWDNGYPSGGNYWSDLSSPADDFNGPGQDIPGPDGINDSSYMIETDSLDNYPFISPGGWMARPISDSDLIFGDPIIDPPYPDVLTNVSITIAIIDDGDVVEAKLFHRYDNTSWDWDYMDLSDPPNATATIPAPKYPTMVYFYINATNNEGSSNRSITYSYLAGSELVLTAENISFFSDPAENGSIVSINANIFNEGGALNGVDVFFFLGDPDDDNDGIIDADAMEIGEDRIDIGDFSYAIASTEWFPPDIGAYDIYVWVDPSNATAEIDERNNLAGNTESVFYWVDTFDDMTKTETMEDVSYINGDALIYKGDNHDFDGSEEGFTKNDDYEFSEVYWDSANNNVYVHSDRRDVEDEIYSKDLPISFTPDFPSWTLTARWRASRQGHWQGAFPIFITDIPTMNIEGEPNTIFFHYSSHNSSGNPWYHLRYRGSDGVEYIYETFIGTPNTEYRLSISYDANTRVLLMEIFDAYDIVLASVQYDVSTSPGDDFILGKIGVASDGRGDSYESTIEAWTDDINLSVSGDVGNITSYPIDLQHGKRWSALYIDRTEPENTFINVSIIDLATELPVPGFKNMTENIIDLAPLDPLLYPSIKLVGKFRGNETASPILHYWAIDWDDILRADAGPDGYIDEGIPFPFNGSGSEAEGGIVNYAWDIDASDGVDWQSPDYSGPDIWDPMHTYQIPGTYTVILNITNDNGDWDTDTMILTVRDVTKPVVDAGTDTTIEKGIQHIFDASFSYDPEGGTIVYYNWSFGDGSYTNGSNPMPSHTYITSGVYIVTLKITDERGGNWNETSITITVGGLTPPEIVQTISDIELKEDDPPYSLNLFASAIDDEDLPQHLKWFITDIDYSLYTVSGQVTNTLIITPKPDIHGDDFVTLWVYDSDNLSDSQPLWINITPKNDKPFFSPLPPDLTVTMDVSYAFDYAPYVSDIDNAISELEITTNDPEHTSVTNQVVSFLYPASMVNEQVFLILTLSDGIDSTSEFIRVFISDDNVPALRKKLPDVTINEGDTEYDVFDLDEYFYDPDGDAIYYSYGYTHIGITINEDHTVDFNAVSSWYGEETVTFRAHDPGFAIVEDTILVTVHPINDAPSISNVPDLVVHHNASYYFDLTPYITDEDNSLTELTLIFMELSGGSWVNSQYLNVSEDNNLGMVVHYPDQFLNTTLHVRITVSDGPSFASDTININVTDDWPPQLVMEIPDIVFYEDEYISDYFNVNDYFWDKDGDILIYASGQVHVQVIIYYNGSVDFYADENWFGMENITIRATDPSLALVEDIITVSVLPVNDAPVIAQIPNQEGVRGETWILDLDPYIYDFDDNITELEVTCESQYIMVAGTVLIFQYPSDMEEDVVHVTITDPKDANTTTVFNITLRQVGIPKGGGIDLVLYLSTMILIIAILSSILLIYAFQRGKYVIEELFLVYTKNSLLLYHKYEGDQELKDREITASMFAAVQEFVSDAFDSEDHKRAPLKEMEIGDKKVMIERGKYTHLAAVFKGGTWRLEPKLKETIMDLESNNIDLLENWDGTMDNLKCLEKFIEDLM